MRFCERRGLVEVGLGLALTLVGNLAHAHPNSLSRTGVSIDRGGIVVVHRAQTLTWAEALPELDLNGDGDLDRREVQVGQNAIARYWTERVAFAVGADRRAVKFDPTRVTVAWAESPFDASSPFRAWSWLSIEAAAPGISTAIDALTVEFRAYFETSPDHVDYCTVRADSQRPDEPGALFALDRAHPRAEWLRDVLPARGVFRIFFVGGWLHILGGWDHLAFLAALLLAARGVRSLLLVMTAFTAAHALTLSLAATGVVDPRGYSHLVEMAIALSVAYVAVDQWVHRKNGRTRWFEAFFFGAIHGLGFAGYLREALPDVGAVALPLFSFHLGIEAGQLVVLVTAAWIVRRLPGEREQPDVADAARSDSEPFLVPSRLRGPALLGVAALGLTWFALRV